MSRPKESRLVFFRVNYPHWWGKEVAESILREAFALPEGKHGEYRGRAWYTGEFDALTSGRWLFKLGKVREDLTHGTLKAEQGHYVFPVEGEGPVVPVVRCLYEPSRNLLVSETTNEISWNQIKGSLEAIFSVTRTEMERQRREAGDIGHILLQPLQKKIDFFEWALDVDVTSVSFTFWPTNPNPRRSFERWDQEQQEAKSDETRLVLRSKSNEINVKSELIETGISQVTSGYGKASASGKSDGVTQTWHSARALVMRVVGWFDRKEEIDREWGRVAQDAEKDDDESPR